MQRAWFLLPPHSKLGRPSDELDVPGGWPSGSVVEWSRGDRRWGSARALECTQEEGEMLWLPSGWGHATVNLKASLSMAVQQGVELPIVEDDSLTDQLLWGPLQRRVEVQLQGTDATAR